MAEVKEFDDKIQDVAKTIKDLEASMALQEGLVRKLGDQYFREKFGLRLGDILLDDNDKEYRFLEFVFSTHRLIYDGWSLDDFSYARVEVVMIKPDGTTGKLAHELSTWRKKEEE